MGRLQVKLTAEKLGWCCCFKINHWALRLVVSCCAVWISVQARGDTFASFTAYNDIAWQADDGADVSSPFTKYSPSVTPSGSLMSVSGATLPVTVVIATNSGQGAINYFALSTNVAQWPTGTDAANEFQGKVGRGYTCELQGTGVHIDVTFSGLSATKAYKLVVWCSRLADGSNYSNRLTDVTLSGMVNFTNTSSETDGVTRFAASVAQDSTSLRATFKDGYAPVARFEAINPGSDGMISFRVKRNVASAGNGYLNAFMLQEITTVPAFNPASAPPVVINEIMYKPNEPWGTTNATHYVELYNPNGIAVDLSDCRFDNGIDYTFPNGTTLGAGQYLVVCEDLAQFALHYPTVTNAIGNFSSGLSGNGERITLSRWNGLTWNTVDTFNYVPSGLSDGAGYSLELVHPGFGRLRDQYACDWLDSQTISGTPGRVNSVFTNYPLPVLGDAWHNPPRPFPGSAITVSARVAGRDSDSIDVRVQYRKDTTPPQPWSVMEMCDSGFNGDTVAGDGYYSARIPPVGGPVMASGDVLEWRFLTTDAIGTRQYPATNTAAITNGIPLSYVACFSDDTGNTGEYPTYYMTMLATNRSLIEHQQDSFWNGSDDRLDTTLTTSDGDIYYNCGTHYHGSSSRINYDSFTNVPPIHNPHSFNIKLPAGVTVAGDDKIVLLFLDALYADLGMKIFNDAGKDIVAPGTQLARLWLNESNKTTTAWQGIYVRIQDVDRNFIRSHFDDASGGIYQQQVTTANFIYTNSLSYYTNVYAAATQNPYTAWSELTNLMWVMNQPASQLPSILESRIDTRAWARTFAIHTVLGNDESGIGCSMGPSVDELRLYCNPEDGRFALIPWDVDGILSTNYPNSTIWDWGKTNSYSVLTPPVISNFLFNPPMVSWYVGDLADVATNLMSDTHMNAWFDEMGSAVTYTFRTNMLDRMARQRTFIMSQISTSFTVNVNGSMADASAVLVTNVYLTGNGWRGSAIFSGQAPMNYSARVHVNGQDAAAVKTRAGTWSSVTNVEFPLGGTVHLTNLTIETANNNGTLLESRHATVIDGRVQTLRGGTIATNASWGPADGVIVLSAPITISAGAILTLQAGAIVVVPPGMDITISSGQFRTLGTATSTVTILPTQGSTSWNLVADGSSALISLQYANLSQVQLVIQNGATGTLVDCAFTSASAPAYSLIAVDAGPLSLQRVSISDFVRNVIINTPITIDSCLFERPTELAMDISGGTATVSRTTFRNGESQPGIGGIQLADVISSTMSNVLVSDVSGTGIELSGMTRARLSHSVVQHAGIGMELRSSSVCTNYNNTLSENGIGMAGSNTVMWNTILWRNDVAVSNGPGTASYCDIERPGNQLYAGTTNLNRDPLFRSNKDEDFSLLSQSPLRTAGQSSGTMGATYPVGANPKAPTSLVATNLSVTQIQLSWFDNSTDETAFEVQRSKNGSDWDTITNVPAGVVTCLDSGLNAHESYYYRVRSVHGRGESQWSDTATAQTAMGNTEASLRMTEIMYAPPTAQDLAEFIELKNIGQDPIDLSGLMFTNGIDYTFTNGTLLAAGGFFVIVRDAAAFATNHPGVPYQGIYQGALDNVGERLRIKDATSNTVLDVTYQNGATDSRWYPTTYKGGYSLVLVDPAGDMASAATWRSSTSSGGSPGADDPVPSYGNIVINEILAHTDPPLDDTIELYNAGTTTVNVAGWYLSDSTNNLRMYQIPTSPAVNITAGTCRVFYSTNSFGTAFLLSEFGESLYLSSASGTNLTSYRTWINFDGTDNGVSLGRYLRSDGVWDFTTLNSRTLGTNPNASPRIGPVVINEIMYNPASDGNNNEFIELFNTASTNVALYLSTNSWRLADGIDYSFPANVTLSPNERILVTAMDPTSFRATFGLTNLSLRIYGPFNGSLDNAGETVKLYKPGDTDPNGSVPWILMDLVQYNNRAPWPPEANGEGPSLERRNALAYGNDPTNWAADTIGGTPGATNNASDVPSLAFDKTGTSLYESNALLTIKVIANPAPTSTVTLSYSVGGTANSGSDYSLSSGTLTFSPYESSRYLSLQVIGDGVQNEPDETVVVTLTSITSGTGLLGGNKTYTATIVDTNTGTLSAPVMLPGGATVPFTNSITVTITSAVPSSVIRYTLDGTTPDTSSPAYTNTLTLNTSTRVKARLYVGSWNAGPVTSALFTSQSTSWNTGPDADRDGVPDAWEQQYLGGTNSAASDDTDGDGLKNGEEYLAGTDPANPNSNLAIQLNSVTGIDSLIQWRSVTGRTYRVYKSLNLSQPWPVWPEADSITADPSGTNTLSDTEPARRVFYRISVTH